MAFLGVRRGHESVYQGDRFCAMDGAKACSVPRAEGYVGNEDAGVVLLMRMYMSYSTKALHPGQEDSLCRDRHCGGALAVDAALRC